MAIAVLPGMPTGVADIEPKIARCRLVLSLVAIVAVWVDPTAPTLMPRLHLRGGGFAIDPYALAVLGAHLLYSVAVRHAVTRGLVTRRRLVSISTWCDVVFGALIVMFTEGTSSPFWAFFVFAVFAAGTHGGFRRSMVVTTVSVGMYLSLIVVAWHGQANFYIMRPVYLAVVGYLTAYLGQQRLSLQAQVHQLRAARERNRIARALHDGCVQTLAGINLTLESCQELARADRRDELLTTLADLQTSINREYDELRAYVRDLADVEPSPAQRAGEVDTRFMVSADFAGSGAFIDQVLQVVREAAANVRRHARARSAVIAVRAVDSQVHVTVDDDGMGFADPERVPWSIASRVSEAGGTIRVARDGPGAHLRLTFPEG